MNPSHPTSTALLERPPEWAPEPMTDYAATYRAGVIGSTSGGHSGHGLDVVFVGLTGVETVAVADGPSPKPGAAPSCPRDPRRDITRDAEPPGPLNG